MFAPRMIVRRPLAPLDEAERRRHKVRNVVQSALLLGGMFAIMALCGWLLFGWDGLLGIGLGGAFALFFSPRISPRMVLRLYRAQELAPERLPDVFRILTRLAERAGLARRPRLYYVPSTMLNAFAVGRADDVVIAVTDGLLRTLSLRELAGVLAHEISHVRNNDLWLMNLADLAGRITRLMALFGIVLLVMSLPLWLIGQASAPWLLVPLLLFAPQLTTLLQLALSRSREFDADLDAAGLTGDPDGLASALLKLERHQRGPWEQIFMPGYRLPEPSLLRSHPATAGRVARLEALHGTPVEEPLLLPGFIEGAPIECAWPRIVRTPRGRLVGYWY